MTRKSSAVFGFRSTCPIARTLDILGDKWTLLVVRDLMLKNRHTFQELLSGREHIPTSTLTDRLKRLERWGLIFKRPYQTNPIRYEYHLSEAGESLRPLIEQIQEWAGEYLPNP